MEEIYAIENELSMLEESLSALEFIEDALEDESRASKTNEELAAITFARRFPGFLATMRALSRDMGERARIMQKVINDAYAGKAGKHED